MYALLYSTTTRLSSAESDSRERQVGADTEIGGFFGDDGIGHADRANGKTPANVH